VAKVRLIVSVTMPKYRKTVCQDEGFSKGMWFFSPIDLRKKYYKCNHCQKEHLVKDGIVKDKPVTVPDGCVTGLKKVLHAFECDCQECLDKWERLKE